MFGRYESKHNSLLRAKTVLIYLTVEASKYNPDVGTSVFRTDFRVGVFSTRVGTGLRQSLLSESGPVNFGRVGTGGV